MSKQIEALKLALEQAYLAGFNASADGYNGECGVGNASQCTQWLTERDNYIREALAEQPAQQEPVARLHITETDTYPDVEVEVLDGTTLQPSMSPVNVYTTPPQRKPWVGLTDEEYKQAEAKVWAVVSMDDTEKEANREFYEAIEAKLREKNA